VVNARQRFERLWIAAFIGYDSLGGAVFEASPVVETTQAMRAGIAIRWIVWPSE